MTRTVSFSSGHRYWKSDLTPAENRELFGPWASPYNHGHNYVLEVSVDGDVTPRDGMIINIKRVDDALKAKVLRDFDQKSLNDEVAEFAQLPPTCENILRVIHARLTDLDVPRTLSGAAFQPIVVAHLRLTETPLLYAELFPKTNMLTLTRVYEFAASHRLNSPHLSAEENRDLYGKCNNPAGHGHNYVLQVTVTGTPNARSGMVVDIGELDAAVERLVLDRYDHKNLDVDVPELAGKITTSEIVANEIFRQLDGRLPAKLAKICLYETARNAFEVSAEPN